MLIVKFGSFKIAEENVISHTVIPLKSQRPRFLFSCAFFLTLILTVQDIFAQGNITFDLKKPKLYENRKLPSELTPDKKINPIKKAKENIVSHYNFYFNANKKLNGVLANAKQSFKDTFNNLIPFFNYNLDQTASQQSELDSVIIKCNNGILLHDLRNDWVDDLYLLMGQSYFYQKKFDSAYDVFQYINYNFQPKEKDEIGFEKSIGSNINTSGNVYTISSKEKKGIERIIGHLSIRNESLIWIARTLIEMNNDDDAKSLIETLYRDPQFPNRLKDKLAELKAYFFYRRTQYDSSANYLEKSVETSENTAERARKYFLIAQLYAQKKIGKKADQFFEKSISNTTDPVMEAFARIQQIGLNEDDDNEDKKIETNIQSLLLMSKKEKYTNYKGIIYYSAAQLELKRKKLNNAINLLIKSNEFNQSDLALKNKNFISIAELAFVEKNYTLAKNYYDSIRAEDLASSTDLTLKRSIVSELVNSLRIVATEDSLQLVAAMNEKDRTNYILDIVKKLKKEQGFIDENEKSGIPSTPKNNILDVTTGSLFPTESKKGESYFNNPALKAQGSTAFKNKWGTRPNIDNWRRAAASNTLANSNLSRENKLQENTDEDTSSNQTELTVEGLTEKLPLTIEKLTESNEKKYAAYKKLGNLYKNKLGECKESIFWNEKLIAANPTNPDLEQILFDLAYCFKEAGDLSKTSFYQNQLGKNFSNSKYNLILKDPAAAVKAEKQNGMQATKAYENVYNLFLSGNFDQALVTKKIADSVYGENLWSPQLLYIESIYYIKKKDDSLAIATLNKIPALYPSSPLAEKAGIIADVINRRADIENELKGLQVSRAKEDTIEWIDDSMTREKIADVKITTAPKAVIPVTAKEKIKIDTVALKVPITEKIKIGYQFDINEKQVVLLLLKNVDIVYINEAKRAITRYHGSRYAGNELEIGQGKIEETIFIQVSTFTSVVEAIDYIEQTQKLGATEIFPWLPKDKYSFILISPSNLKLMMEEKKLIPYLEFLKNQLPGKF